MLTLEKEWNERKKLRAEGNKLRAEGDKLYVEGDKLYAEGYKLRAEGYKLFAEGDLFFINAVIAKFGNVDISYDGNDWIVQGERYE